MRPTTRDRLHRAPDFVMVGGGELQAQRGLSFLARALLTELLAIADFATGHIRTSYAALLVVLAVDHFQGQTKPERLTQRRIRSAIAELCWRGLVKRDAIRNEKAQVLFLKVPTRNGIRASNNVKVREKVRCGQPAKRATARVSNGRAPDEGQGEGQVVQENQRFISRESWPASSPQPVPISEALKPVRFSLRSSDWNLPP